MLCCLQVILTTTCLHFKHFKHKSVILQTTRYMWNVLADVYIFNLILSITLDTNESHIYINCVRIKTLVNCYNMIQWCASFCMSQYEGIFATIWLSGTIFLTLEKARSRGCMADRALLAGYPRYIASVYTYLIVGRAPLFWRCCII